MIGRVVNLIFIIGAAALALALMTHAFSLRGWAAMQCMGAGLGAGSAAIQWLKDELLRHRLNTEEDE